MQGIYPIRQSGASRQSNAGSYRREGESEVKQNFSPAAVSGGGKYFKYIFNS